MKSLISAGKNLKHIKLQGLMVSCGEYDTSDVDIRPYEAVTLRDTGGEEVFFRYLLVPKRIDETFNIGDEVTFYLLRHKDKKGQILGALYALEIDGNKLYYPDQAWKAIKSLALQSSRRWALLSIPVLFALIAPLSAFIVFSAFAGVFYFFGQTVSMLAGFGAAGFWIYALLFPLLKTRAYVNADEMDKLILINGFKPVAVGVSSNKY